MTRYRAPGRQRFSAVWSSIQMVDLQRCEVRRKSHCGACVTQREHRSGVMVKRCFS